MSRPSIRLMMSTSSLASLFRNLRAILAREYDVIQTDELIANGMLAAGASVIYDIPLVVAIRGWADYTNAHGQYGWLKDASIRARTRLALHQTSEVIFISDTTSETFREQYPVTQYSVIAGPSTPTGTVPAEQVTERRSTSSPSRTCAMKRSTMAS